MQVIGYVRVSTDEQSLSVEAQQQALEDWCTAQHAELVSIFADVGISGGTPIEKRPGLLDALNALTRGRILLVVRRDRLARDSFTAAMCEKIAEKAGASIYTVIGAGNGEGPEALLMRQILDAFAQYEKTLIAMRIKAGLARKRDKGEYLGCPPYGKQLDADGRHLVENPAEQRIILLVQELRASGLSLRRIVSELGRLGLVSRAQHPFSLTQVARMLDAA